MRSFLLNNELTDFNSTGDGPNVPAPGKRPRSSMSPTLVLDDGAPFLAVGTPGGSTIITTVVEILHNRIDRGMTLPEAIVAPRATQRNTTTVGAEAEYRALYETALTALGHVFSDRAEIGATTGIEILPDGALPRRRRARAAGWGRCRGRDSRQVSG